MARSFDTISFLSDYGTHDEFVGVVKSVIRSIAPDVGVVDITHEIAPFDIRAGALALARSAQYLCPGVVLAVVDPGVGTERRPIAVEVGRGASVLVGPDNGLLASAVAMVGGATAAVELTNPEYRLPAPGPTFDGRDVFAPAAAHLCAGAALDDLGEAIDPAGLQPGVLPLTRREEEGVIGEVLWVDRYGNAQLNVDPDEIDDLGDPLSLRLDATSRVVRRVRTFAELGVGHLGLIVDSYGLIAVVADRASASDELGLHEGDPITLAPLGGDERPSGVSTTVTLGPTNH